MDTRLKYEDRAVKRRRRKRKGDVGKRGKGQTGRCSVRMERNVGVGVASKNSIWVLALKAWEFSGFNLFCQIGWRTQTILVAISQLQAVGAHQLAYNRHIIFLGNEIIWIVRTKSLIVII
jgi:hypothetical protein